MTITLSEFNNAINMLKPFIVKTKMEKWTMWNWCETP